MDSHFDELERINENDVEREQFTVTRGVMHKTKAREVSKARINHYPPWITIRTMMENKGCSINRVNGAK